MSIHPNPFSVLQTHFNLCHLFERILHSWGAAEVRHLGEIQGQPSGLEVERSVVLTGTLNGFLTVRTSSEFLAWLREKRQGTFLGRYPETELLEELISLFSLYLFHDFWNPSTFHIGPIQPFPSTPSDWPVTPPHAACTLLVEGHLVEIRLWMKD